MSVGRRELIDVRRATTGDEHLWLSAVSSVLPGEAREDGTASVDEISAAIADPSCFLFLALSSGAPVGLLSAYAVPDLVSGGFLAYLYDIEVAEAHRRSGIGRSLIEALLGTCKMDGVKLVWAGTELGNTPARRAFEHTGAELEGDQYAEYEWEIR